MKKHNVVIIGGGPAGSTLGTMLAQRSIDVALFEKEAYPRFHIGESLLPASMPIFKETGFYDVLSGGKYIRKYGAQFVDYLSDDEIYFGFDNGFNPDIPMAFEVPRAEFDKDLLDHARTSGVHVHQSERVWEVTFFDSFVRVDTNAGQYECRYLIDASGRDSFLGKRMKLQTVHSDLNNVAVFAHYVGVKRRPERNEGDIVIGVLPLQSWSWIIPFMGDKTSVGVVSNSRYFNPGTDLAEYLETSLSASPRLKEIMSEARRVTEVSAISNYSHYCSTYAGERWLLAGDAAAFLDPIFSNGVHVGLMSAKFACVALVEALQKNIGFVESGLGVAYRKNLNRGIDRFHALVSLFYRDNFVARMRKTLERPHMKAAFTSAVAGDMWNDNNVIFQMNVL